MFPADAFMNVTLSDIILVFLKTGLSNRLPTYLPEQAC